ncbi:hypothetical protein PTSG_05727 [Salpingoeca rosetta]|uniref:Uncharacterized protein n=1 Tax=Salpingoeca rosetta (strain ATCC 50818 / BSB-021) TaxID=946362 RepID=F2UB19_SALR5|nr:uncharacterized protein PTSG_05727 [Salpingoeca rosetta]EGD74032.1 hypothetical protein PTSG_05727 [Salpingoeca rosetta]|eukprot:XP_004993594.1 hypothetical protein PTSG_05727 [Salpingoeca rosetta]
MGHLLLHPHFTSDLEEERKTNLRHTMRAVVVVAALVALVATTVSAKTLWHQLDGYSFEHFKAEYGKRYLSSEEHDFRRQVFERTLASVKAHNSDPTKTWKQGINHMSDWTDGEFKRLLGYDKGIGYSLHRPTPPGFKANVDVNGLPDSVDWRTKHVVTAVKDQGQCGSCWSFGSAETLESHVAVQTGTLEVLSEQNILDCTPNPEECGGTGGCQGGTAEIAYEHMAKHGGLQTEWTYPYLSWYGDNYKCHFKEKMSVVNVTGYVKLPSNQYEPLMDAIANKGPISISVEAVAWKNYESGIFDGCNQTNPDIDHAVQLVGYGDDNSQGYWLVRNSWTPHWGESGYIRIRRTANEGGRCGMDITPQDGSGCKGGPDKVKVCGTCGILFDNVYPTIGVPPS